MRAREALTPSESDPMAPRSSWKGYIKLSLVSVPVKAFTAANSGEEIRLNQLHKDCNLRVKYQKVCPEHGELKNDEIVSGYEYAKDQYVVVDTDEVSKLRSESDRSISLFGFTETEAIDPIHMAGKTYYLLPDGVAGNRPYTLLREGMVSAGVCGIAQVVMSGREQLVMVRPLENMLVMTFLNYAQKTKMPSLFIDDVPSAEASPQEMELTKTLIEASRIEFDPNEYEDQYVAKLTKLIEMKIEGEEVVQAPAPEEPKILNLMDALKKSVAEAQSGARRKMAPSVKEAEQEAAPRKKAGGRKKKTG